NLSGGQKQRIALARAVLKNPEIIVLDEATSALDSESEEKLLRRLKSQADDKTLIIVSHRLSAVREVDEIVCMDEGKIVEKGTHAELMQKKGHYWELFKTQIANN
ncbi:MAG: ATP-binding cassette domain-containing protein, partial [Gemmatimonadetes bacterium]|nr:ATP-binding cassette domain-containing protein [Gemmatimonadota bacterium]